MSIRSSLSIVETVKLQDSQEIEPFTKVRSCFEGRFIYLESLGEGAFGSVFRVQEISTNHFFVLKQLRNKKFCDRFFSEVNTLSKMQHPSIIRIFDWELEKPAVLMENSYSPSLSTYLRAHVMSVALIKFISAQLISSIEYIHSCNVVHRDLKLSNVLIEPGSHLIKVIDFDFAKSLVSGERTYTICGTPFYISPEVVLRKGHDHLTDIWSLAVCIFKLCYKKFPFAEFYTSDSEEEIQEMIQSLEFVKRDSCYSIEMEELLRSILRYEPSERACFEQIKKASWFRLDSSKPSCEIIWSDPIPRLRFSNLTSNESRRALGPSTFVHQVTSSSFFCDEDDQEY